MSLFYAQQLDTIAPTAYISWTYAWYALYLIYIKIYQKLMYKILRLSDTKNCYYNVTNGVAK